MSLKRFSFGSMTALLLLALILAVPVNAATYYVSLTGSDGNPGSENQPWRTINKASQSLKAGDTAVIGPGDYDEHVYETSSGSIGNYITYRASQPHAASLRAFRLGGQYIRLDGLKLNHYSGVLNTWGAAVRVEAPAHNCLITNCWISDAPYVIAHDFTFHSSSNYVFSPSSDFIAAGFTSGSRIKLGASGMAGLWYTNHDTFWAVASNTVHGMWLTNATRDSLASDMGSNYWAFIYISGASGLYGVYTAASGGAGPTNLAVIGNTISNWPGFGMFINSRGGRVENNRATELKSFYFLSFAGDNFVVRSNVVRNSPNVLHYTQNEIAGLVHPLGGNWLDYEFSMTRGESTATTAGGTNQLFEWNWFENLEDQMGRVDDGRDDTYGITYRNNVFIGMSKQFSGGRDGMHWISNTFYRAAYDAGNPLSLGGRAPVQTNYVLMHNLFIDCGAPEVMSVSGWYSFSANAVLPFAASNMVASAEVSGFAAKKGFTESDGVNGGDPGFVSVLDPAGPDGIPFTADDGLKVLPNSLGARVGGGALGVYQIQTDYPVAHFRLSAPLGWFEPTEADYNPSWWTNTPTRRESVLRPHTTPPSIGNAPVDAIFNAELSIPGVGDSLSGAAITRYVWDFGDGTSAESSGPIISHRFSTAGDRTVKLTVENTTGNRHTASNIYRIAGTNQTGQRPVPPANLRVIATAVR